MILDREAPQEAKHQWKFTEEEKEYFNQIYEDYKALDVPFEWATAYSNYDSLVTEGGKGFPTFTHFKSYFQGTLDYIFYTKNQ